MKFLSKCELLEKTVVFDNYRKVDVLGLASFRTEPRGMGVGFYVCGKRMCKDGEKFILCNLPGLITTTEEW
jgi:hypothetical protein